MLYKNVTHVYSAMSDEKKNKKERMRRRRRKAECATDIHIVE